MTSTGILPSYQRFINGVPVPFSRRSFRAREKYVIFTVFITFGLICFGTFFFLPEFRGTSNADSVYKMYDQIKRSAPELLIPVPPVLEDSREPQKLFRHEGDAKSDPHLLDDREKLKAKIEQDRELKVLERPAVDVRTSSTAASRVVRDQVENNDDGAKGNGQREDRGLAVVTVPPAVSDHYPSITGGEDKDSVVKERRNKVKEVMGAFFYNNYNVIHTKLKHNNNHRVLTRRIVNFDLVLP